MNSKLKYSLLGLIMVTMLVYWNNEIYEHRTHMSKANELYAEGKYGLSLDELKEANQFPFHLKTQKYISYMETKKQQDMHNLKIQQMKENQVLEDYVQWLDRSVFADITNGYAAHGEGTTYTDMKNIFYKLNYQAQEKKITLPDELMDLHVMLINYLNKNQMAYSHWENGENTAAEKLRQEAIGLHTDFVMAFNETSKEICGGKLSLKKHLY